MYQSPGLLIVFYGFIYEQIPGLSAFTACPADNKGERTICISRMPAALPQQTSF